MQNLLGRLDMRLTVDPRSAVVTIVALYETMLERAILDDLPGVAVLRIEHHGGLGGLQVCEVNVLRRP